LIRVERNIVFKPLLLLISLLSGLIGVSGHHRTEQAGSAASFHVNAPMVASDSAAAETLPLITGSDPGVHAVEPGDSRVHYVRLPTSATSPLAVVNGAVVFVAADETGRNWLYRVDGTGGTVTRQPFSAGGGSPASPAQGFVAIGSTLFALSDGLLTAMYSDGTTSMLTMPSAASPLTDAGFASGLFAGFDRLLVLRSDEQALYVIDPVSPLTLVQRVPTPAHLSPPRLALSLSPDEVLIWSPTASRDLSPGGGVLNLATGAFTEVGRTYAMPPSALRGARIVASERGNPQQLAFDAAPDRPQMSLPLAEGADGTVWTSPDLSRAITRTRPDGSQDVFQLPVFEYIPSCPSPPPGQPSNCPNIRQGMTFDSAAVTGSGALVFVSQNSPASMGLILP
jgi:hypothetical protein